MEAFLRRQREIRIRNIINPISRGIFTQGYSLAGSWSRAHEVVVLSIRIDEVPRRISENLISTTLSRASGFLNSYFELP